MVSRQILVSFVSTADFCVTLGRHGCNLKCQIHVGIGLEVGKCVGHGRDDGREVCKCGHGTDPVEELLADVRPERVADPVHLPCEVIRHDLFPGVLEVVGDALGRSVAGEIAEHGRNIVKVRRQGSHDEAPSEETRASRRWLRCDSEARSRHRRLLRATGRVACRLGGLR
jgi:hypothetical protein